MTQETQDRGVVTTEEKLAYLAEVCQGAVAALVTAGHDYSGDPAPSVESWVVGGLREAIHRVTEPRLVMFIQHTVTAPDGEFIPCIAVEGEAGYNATDWAWGKDFDRAEKWCEERNTEQGIGKIEAARIVLGTMRPIGGK